MKFTISPVTANYHFSDYQNKEKNQITTASFQNQIFKSVWSGVREPVSRGKPKKSDKRTGCSDTFLYLLPAFLLLLDQTFLRKNTIKDCYTANTAYTAFVGF